MFRLFDASDSVIWTGLDDRLAAETVKARDLGKELEEVKANLQAEASDHEALSAAVGLVMSDLGMTSPPEVSSLATRAVGITSQARGLARDAFRFGGHRSFAIARSHYDNIDLEAMSEGFAPGYTDAQLDKIEVAVAPLAQDLAKRVEDEVVPREG